LLENVEIYRLRDKVLRDFLVEFYDGKATIMVFEEGNLRDIIDIEAKDFDEVENYISQNYGNAIKIPILEKLNALAYVPFLILVIRHIELTRCGEYIELVFLLRSGIDPSRIYLMLNKNIEVSTMLNELIDYVKINLKDI